LLLKPTSSFHPFLMYPLLFKTQKGIRGPSSIPVLLNNITFFWLSSMVYESWSLNSSYSAFFVPLVVLFRLCAIENFRWGFLKDMNQSIIEKDSIYLWKTSNFWCANTYYSHIGFGKWNLACSGAKYLHDDFFEQASDQNLKSYFILPLKTTLAHRLLIKSINSLKLSWKGAGIAS